MDNKYNLYEFLPESIRSNDGDEILKRAYDNCSQPSYDILFQKIIGLLELYNPDTINENLLSSILTLIGWNKLTQPVLDLLTVQDKRKLLSIGTDFWTLKGTKEGIADVFLFFTGKSVLIKDYFDFRWIIGEKIFEDNSFELISDPYLSYNDENIIVVEIMDEGDLNHTLISSLMSLFTTIGEIIDVQYYPLLELFDLNFDKWKVIGTPEVIDGIATLSLTDSITAMTVNSANFTHYWYNSKIKFSGKTTFKFYYDTVTGKCYLIELENKTITLKYYNGSAYTTISTATDTFLYEDTWYFIKVDIQGILHRQIRIYIDNNRVIDVNTTIGVEQLIGTISYLTEGELQIDSIELYQNKEYFAEDIDGFVLEGETISAEVGIMNPVYFNISAGEWMKSNQYTPRAEGIYLGLNKVLIFGYLKSFFFSLSLGELYNDSNGGLIS